MHGSVIRRPLLRTVWPPAYCEVFPLMGAFCELRITAGCSVEALPQPQVASDTNKRTDSSPLQSLEPPLCSPSSLGLCPEKQDISVSKPHRHLLHSGRQLGSLWILPPCRAAQTLLQAVTGSSCGLYSACFTDCRLLSSFLVVYAGIPSLLTI